MESAPGKSSTFTILLPAHRQDTAAPRPEESRITQGSGTVMVLDDEEMVRQACRQMLAHLGYDAVCVADGKEAIDTYRQHMAAGKRIDAVIMDLTIPGGMGGKEAASGILAIDPQARLIVASGYSNDPVMARFQEHGFAASMVKPFTLSLLGDTLHRILRKRP